VVFQARKIIERLLSRRDEAAASGFLLDEELALPEQIEVAALLLGQTDAVLEARDSAPGDAEKLEKFIVESLGLAALVMRVFPLLGELRGAGLDVVPVEAHGQGSNRERLNNNITSRKGAPPIRARDARG